MTPLEMMTEEYQTLRDEVAASMEELGHVERYCIYAVAAGFAWLSTRPLCGSLVAAWFIPPAIVLFGMLRSWTISVHLAWLSQYLARIEDEAYAGASTMEGWEHFLGQEVKRKGRKQARRGIRARVTYLLWAALLVLTVAFSFFGFYAQTHTSLPTCISQPTH